VHGLVPETIQVYLDAVEQDNVWVQGWHWQRAISLLFNVRVAVVIFGQRVVRFIGQGPVTIYLYKVDAETHFDPMLPLAPDQAVQWTLPRAFSSSQERVDEAESRFDEAPTVFEIKSDSEDGSEPKSNSLPTTLPQEGVHSRPVRVCRVKRERRSSSSSEDVAAAAAPGECTPCTTLRCTLLHFLIQSQCAALPECSAQKRAAAMMTTSLSPPELVALLHCQVYTRDLKELARSKRSATAASAAVMKVMASSRESHSRLKAAPMQKFGWRKALTTTI
jgi:hypothetical protein